MSRMQQEIEADRRRYEELRAAGQELTPKGLPELTGPDGAPIAPDTVIHRERVPAGWHATIRLRHRVHRGRLEARNVRVGRRTPHRLIVAAPTKELCVRRVEAVMRIPIGLGWTCDRA